NKTTSGVDALFSTVQMPPGIPVATVAINGAKNAGFLAAQIIALTDAAIAANVSAYRAKQASDVIAKDQKLQEMGFKKYLEDNGLI
ncbi:MAG: AIR carboxylase family protein, partial [Patescibacteria group bacterium]